MNYGWMITAVVYGTIYGLGLWVLSRGTFEERLAERKGVKHNGESSWE